MRKIVLVTSGLIFFAVAFVACFDEKDFEFDKLTLRDLEPTLHLPLVDDTIRLSADNDYNVFYDDETGLGYLSFDINETIMPDVEEFFNVPDASCTLTNISFTLPIEGATMVVTVGPQSYTAKFPFSGDGQLIESITFKAGILTFGVPSDGAYTITIPKLEKAGVPFTAQIPAAVDYDLSGYTLTMDADNAFRVDMTLSIQATGSYNFDAGMGFSGVEIKEAHGYFGSTPISTSTGRVDVSAFDKFSSATGTVLRIKEAYLDFDVYNGAGFPILLNIEEVKSYITPGGEPSTVTNAGSVTITANKTINESGQSYSKTECHVGGTALGEVLSNMPSQVEFAFSAMINPEGSEGGTVKNFLTDASKIEVKNVKARIPLDFSVSGMVLKDTLDFNTSDVTFKDMGLLMNVKNHMPVGVTLQAYLMDDSGHRMVPNVTLFKQEVNIKANTDDPNIKVEANTEKLAQAKKIEVEITINTAGSDYVQVTRDSYIHLKIGAKAKVNIDNLID
jgi:hypothetical protein